MYVHLSNAIGRLDKSKGIVEVCPEGRIDVLGFPDIARAVSVPTLIVADSPLGARSAARGTGCYQKGLTVTRSECAYGRCTGEQPL